MGQVRSPNRPRRRIVVRAFLAINAMIALIFLITPGLGALALVVIVFFFSTLASALLLSKDRFGVSVLMTFVEMCLMLLFGLIGIVLTALSLWAAVSWLDTATLPAPVLSLLAFNEPKSPTTALTEMMIFASVFIGFTLALSTSGSITLAPSIKIKTLFIIHQNIFTKKILRIFFSVALILVFGYGYFVISIELRGDSGQTALAQDLPLVDGFLLVLSATLGAIWAVICPRSWWKSTRLILRVAAR